ncbi:hypothetical protein EVAR_80872_1 [Eumeta japonica]|uniref:Uncharacterized protein n=1 Tax=Eumeta variegata TaxID=151549 RepID=A0A4C1V1D0_EUMVA|nr:hypothetical protein EVAR_80872_1 [Eumeta japonica]
MVKLITMMHIAALVDARLLKEEKLDYGRGMELRRSFGTDPEGLIAQNSTVGLDTHRCRGRSAPSDIANTPQNLSFTGIGGH